MSRIGVVILLFVVPSLTNSLDRVSRVSTSVLKFSPRTEG